MLELADGINAAAALAADDHGVAMAVGSDVTLHGADGVISTRRLCAGTDLVEFSRATGARTRERVTRVAALWLRAGRAGDDGGRPPRG